MFRHCVVFALLVGASVFDSESANAQLVFGEQSQSTVGAFGQAGKTWISKTQAALQTEAKLSQPMPSSLRNAETIQGAIDELNELGIDVDLTLSALEDSLPEDETWKVVGVPASISQMLNRYLASKNAVYGVTKNGVLRIISMDEMSDPVHFQTRVYRVNHLAGDFRDSILLAEQIQGAVARDEWEMAGGSATIQPRMQSGHRLLIVSIHYQNHLKLQQLLLELTAASGGRASVPVRSSLVEEYGESSTRLVEVPGAETSSLGYADPQMMLRLSPSAFQGGVF